MIRKRRVNRCDSCGRALKSDENEQLTCICGKKYHIDSSMGPKTIAGSDEDCALLMQYHWQLNKRRFDNIHWIAPNELAHIFLYDDGTWDGTGAKGDDQTLNEYLRKYKEAFRGLGS
jgi:hypothetical protein